MSPSQTLAANEKGALSSKTPIISNVTGKNKQKKTSPAKSSASIFLIITLLVGLVAVGIFAAPIIIIGTIDYGLQESLGFDETVAIMEEQGEYITAEYAMNGNFPSGYANDLADNGIIVGQIANNGDFVRTNSYIADLQDSHGLEIASTVDNYQIISMEDGQLALLFNKTIITANNIVAALESDPKLYGAYSKSLNISAKYYYSDAVNSVYRDLGINRDSFNSWEKTTNRKTNQESFNEILKSILESESDLSINGYDPYHSDDDEEGDDDDEEEENRSFTLSLSEYDNADGIIMDVSDKTVGTDSTKKAAELLNVMVSANEPYIAAKSFVALEEPIQRARIDGDGPINEILNVVSAPNAISYVDANSLEEVTANSSMLQTRNFIAAVSDASYSSEEAASFSRDRILKLTGTADSNIISNTTIATNGKNRSNILLEIGDNDEAADATVLFAIEPSFALGSTNSSYESFSSLIGGNRIVEGGSFLSNTINSRVLGARPSDETTIVAYHTEVSNILARKAEADRATLSPLDISSPNTFLGSIVRTFSRSFIGQYADNQSFVLSSVSSLANLTSSSVSEIYSSSYANNHKNSYTTTFGDCSTTKSAANTEGDLYCNEHNTISTSYMSNTADDWINNSTYTSKSIGSNGEIIDNSDLASFITLGMDREATVGPMSSEACERWKDIPGKQGIFGKITDAISSIFGLYKSCRGVSEDVATGAAYTLSNDNKHNEENKEFSGYILYSTVAALISDEISPTEAYKEQYYKKHPLDNSLPGIMARRSGMTKEDAIVAINYANYLSVVANYNPTNRFMFGSNHRHCRNNIVLLDTSTIVYNQPVRNNYVAKLIDITGANQYYS